MSVVEFWRSSAPGNVHNKIACQVVTLTSIKNRTYFPPKDLVVEVVISYLKKLLGDERVQPSTIKDMAAALRELHALKMTANEHAEEALLVQVAGNGTSVQSSSS